MITRTLIATCCVSAIASGAFAGPITLDLEGRGEPSQLGYGAQGFWFGPFQPQSNRHESNFHPRISDGSQSGGLRGNSVYGTQDTNWGYKSSSLTHEYSNFTWTDVTMNIDPITGDASVGSGIIRDYNGEEWAFEMNLTDIEFRNPDGSFKDGGNFAGAVSLSDIQNVANGINPYTGLSHTGTAGWGYEWKNIDLTLDRLTNTSAITDDWDGLTMSSIGHDNPAELHFDANGRFNFDAWYYANDPENGFHDSKNGFYYAAGDTKASVTGIVPAPGTAAIMGLAGIGATRRRRRA